MNIREKSEIELINFIICFFLNGLWISNVFEIIKKKI